MGRRQLASALCAAVAVAALLIGASPAAAAGPPLGWLDGLRLPPPACW